MAESQINALGQWVVLDRFGDTTTLLAVGNQDLDGVSPRRHLSQVGRQVLLPALTEALSNGSAVDRVAEFGDESYVVRVKPIHTPDKSRVVGAYGIYTEEGRQLPPEPLIGAWQWTVDLTGNNVGDTSSLWDDNLYELHEFPKSASQSSRGPVGDWLTRLLPYEERARVKTTVDAGLAAGNNVHQLLTFGAITRLGTPNPGKKQLSLVGSAVPIEGRPGVHFAYGFTREVQRPSTYRTTGLDVVDPTEFTRAYFALASETAFAAVDCAQSYTFMTSPSWGLLGFYEPFEGDIAALATEKGRLEFETFIEQARQSDGETQLDVKLLRADGTTDWFRVRAARVDKAGDSSRYLILSIGAI
ncbi:hypothetical protein [Frondihabitans peucedani]|uniref:Rv3651-like N-terminal domain-containing protein n=1 Tax=Frondihabitans peucedani TaxID=598626 RepID=A0ABP8E326_9MICO